MHAETALVPLCVKRDACRILKSLAASTTLLPKWDTVTELVVYSCPHFKEKG